MKCNLIQNRRKCQKNSKNILKVSIVYVTFKKNIIQLVTYQSSTSKNVFSLQQKNVHDS